MRSLVRYIVCMAALSGMAIASPLNTLPAVSTNRFVKNSSQSDATPKTARILNIFTPTDLQTNDPQRKVCVLAAGDVPRKISGHELDQHVLKYLREMIDFTRHHRRRDMAWYYEEAWEFASVRIYGALPPRKQDQLGTFYQPANP